MNSSVRNFKTKTKLGNLSAETDASKHVDVVFEKQHAAPETAGPAAARWTAGLGHHEILILIEQLVVLH